MDAEEKGLADGMYEDFAEIYDIFMAEAPYDEWCRLIDGWIKEYGISVKHGAETEANLVLDLGCGTGTLTGMLEDMGYDCIGIDSSAEMLTVAMSKKALAESRILYLCQRMQDLELYSTVGTVISICDSLNYLLSEQEVAYVFRLINNYLYAGGIFIFDFNTVYKYKEVIGDTTIAENREECSFIWDNYYDEDRKVNEYELTFFVKEPDGRYRCFQENHYQRGYTLEQMKGLLWQAGMEFITAFDSITGEAAGEESERIFVIAKEGGKAPVT